MEENTHIDAIDQDTTDTRLPVFDHGGQLVAAAGETHEIHPEPADGLRDDWALDREATGVATDG